LHLGELHAGGDVAGELAAVDRRVENLGEHLVSLSYPLGRSGRPPPVPGDGGGRRAPDATGLDT
jgi:hypothetical protein